MFFCRFCTRWWGRRRFTEQQEVRKDQAQGEWPKLVVVLVFVSLVGELFLAMDICPVDLRFSRTVPRESGAFSLQRGSDGHVA